MASAAHSIVALRERAGLAQSLGPESYRLYLAECRARIESILRPRDKLLELKPNKFCLILEDLDDAARVELAAAKLMRVLEAPAEILDQSVGIEAHAGFALPSSGLTDRKRLIQAAERALAQAIDTGRSFVIDTQPDSPVQETTHTLLPALAQALERGEFTLFYQPKLDAAHQRLVGAEGLVRWLHPESGEIRTPDRFIHLIEASDLAHPFTRAMLKLGVTRCAEWSTTVGLAINVPPKILTGDNIDQMLDDLLAIHRLAPERLTLEITERGGFDEAALQTLAAIRELGCRISIDDFGTGNCSLSHFRALPADEIKIDRSFVSRVRSSKKDLAIVTACIAMARGCGMKIVAEGVEDQATADVLRDLGCDVLQGYLFDPPLPFSEFRVRHLSGLASERSEPDYSAALR